MTDEGGSVALELALGVCVLLFPVAMLVSSLPGWLEREAAAARIAREAARAFVLADDPAQAAAAAERVAQRIASGHGMDVREFDVRVSGALAWDGVVTVSVRTSVPVAWLPGLGPIGGFPLTERHRERVDAYRSW